MAKHKRHRGGRSIRSLNMIIATNTQNTIAHQNRKYNESKMYSLLSTKSMFFEDNKDCFHNLGRFILSDKEKLVLILGAKCIPKPTNNFYATKKAISKSIDKFFRTISLRKLFITESSNLSTPTSSFLTNSLRIPNPNFIPPSYDILDFFKNTVSTKLNERLRSFKRTHQKSKRTKEYSGLHLHLHEGLRTLLSRDDLVIRSTDKNLGIALMSKEYYITECLKHLQNTKHYTEITNLFSVSTNLLYVGLDNIIKTHKVFCSENKNHVSFVLQNRSNTTLRLCGFYIQPKVHKEGNASRPICANTNYPLFDASRYIHIQLLPVIKYFSNENNTNSPILNNNMQLLDQLDKISLNEKPTLVSADVAQLYTNIPLVEGINAVREILYDSHILHHIFKNNKKHIAFILALLNYVLHNCYISFNNEIYLQIQGTAMGTPCAVVFANLYMLHHNYKVIALYNKTLNTTYKTDNIHQPILYSRFIDDLLLIFRCIIYASHYVKCFNSVYPTIQIPDPTISNSEVNFLDMTIYVKVILNEINATNDNDTDNTTEVENQIIYKIFTKLYTKPCNKFIYLTPCSFHMSHVFVNWVKNEFARIRILCKENIHYTEEVNKTKQRLLKRGYSEIIIEQHLGSIPDRDTLLLKIKNKRSKKSKSHQQLTFISTNSDITRSVITSDLLSPNNEIKFFEPICEELFKIPPRLVYKNPLNFGRVLFKNKF